MPFSIFYSYTHNIIVRVPWLHWVGMGVLALTVFLLAWKQTSVYGAFMIGLVVFNGVFLVDATVFLRLIDILPHGFGYSFRVGFDRLFYGSVYSQTEALSNITAFIPFGFSLSEFFASAKRFSARRRIGLVTMAGFALSLCIECLQLVLRVGFLELTDLVMNTLGGGIGASLAVLGRTFTSHIKIIDN